MCIASSKFRMPPHGPPLMLTTGSHAQAIKRIGITCPDAYDKCLKVALARVRDKFQKREGVCRVYHLCDGHGHELDLAAVAVDDDAVLAIVRLLWGQWPGVN